MSIPIAILASGRGSNFDAIHRAILSGQLDAEIRVVITDRAEAEVIQKAEAAGIPTRLVARGEPGQNKQNSGHDAAALRCLHDQKMVEALSPFSPRFLVMAGYMRIVTSTLIEPFRSPRGYARVVNIHPSLLPAFAGVRAYEQVFRHGCRVAGVTVHFVEEQVDSGPILAQEAFSMSDCQSAAEVEKRGLEVEHRLYPATLQWVLPERFEVNAREGRLCVSSN